MLEKHDNRDVRPANDQQRAPVRPSNQLSPVGRTLLIAGVALGVWIAVMLGLVSVGALQIAPALVLIGLAAVVLGVEVNRAARRGPRHNRFGELSETRIEPSALESLLEIEHSSVREERRVLLAREFCRLATDALRPEPAVATTWPDAETLASWRAQTEILAQSSRDRVAEQLPLGRPQGHITDADLRGAIEALQQYVDRLDRMRRIPTNDPEPLRQLMRDQSRLRAMQDQIIAHLRQPTNDS